MGTVLAIRHVPFEDLDNFAAVLTARGHCFRYAEAATDLTACDPLQDDLWIVLGGPMGVYEDAIYPFIPDELRLLRARLAAGLPTIGICLGAQLIAKALGAHVYPGGQKEIGWKPLTFTAAAQHNELAGLMDTPVLHWHGDTFDLPDGVTLLASTDTYPHQAFSWGNHTLALQFHLETTAEGLTRWFIGHADEIAQTDQVDLATLQAQTVQYAARATDHGQRYFATWLESVGL